MKIDKDTLELYKQNIALRKWIPWNEYLTLKIGDKLIMPKFYQDTDKIIGETTVTISKLYKTISKDYWDKGIEQGCLSGKTSTKYFDKNKESTSGGIAGVFSVNLNNVIEEKTIESERERFIKGALDYMSNFSEVVDIKEYEKYLRSL